MLTFVGQLRSSPFAGEPVLSSYRGHRLLSEDDFYAYAAFSKEKWSPVLLSFQQKWALLDRIFAALDTHIGERVERIILSSRVPGTRMPVRLGEGRIFQVVSPGAECARLHASGASFVAVYEGFVRHPMETGRNELALVWHRPPEDSATRDAFEALSLALRDIGLQRPEVDCTAILEALI
ncbi:MULTISPECIES: hypothetical protein [unclassified Paraburkholderia]|uniref:hypothetical protein n=1 Tax=unclassified Paraburkholderia TaxID=2615204 RepID=UPI002AB1D187|nr:MULTISPECIES: hypothetical protein [unclassified Paraburkholderia]